MDGDSTRVNPIMQDSSKAGFEGNAESCEPKNGSQGGSLNCKVETVILAIISAVEFLGS